MIAAPENPDSGVLSGHDIVVLGGGAWDVCPREPDLLTVLAGHGNRGLFVESAGMRRPELHVHDLRRITSRLSRARDGMRSVENGVRVIAPLTVPLPGLSLVRRINAEIQHRATARAMKALGFDRPILWVSSPLFEPLIASLPAELVIYDCFDDWTAFPGVDGRLFGALEARAIRQSDLILAASTPLLDVKRSLAPELHLLRNGVHAERFEGPPPREPEDLANIPRPRIGYAGNIYGRIDVGALASLARSRPDWSVVLIGLVRTPVAELAALPNVHMLGFRPKSEISAYLRHLDVGLVPHAPSPLADRQDPTKIYEYLAAGLPVIAIDLPGIQAFGTWVVRVPFGGGLAEPVAEALASDDESRRRARREEARRHSWMARAGQLSGWIRSALEQRGKSPR